MRTHPFGGAYDTGEWAPRANAPGAFLFPASGGQRLLPGKSRGEAITEPRINDRIRVPEVRLVGPEGEQVGVVSIGEALRLAQDSELDLVEVAPMARPPVCKLMDYGKFKYESAQKAREARRNQALTVIKEMRLRLKIDPHDYETKKGHVERFLKGGDKVKITDEVKFLRIRTKRHELMISPGECGILLRKTSAETLPDERYLLAVLHDPSSAP